MHEPIIQPAEVTYQYRREVLEPYWVWVFRYEDQRITGVSAHPPTMAIGSLPFSHYAFNAERRFLDLFRSIETEYVEVPSA